MSGKRKPVIAISLGDPFGIGPEVTFKALASKEHRLLSRARFLLVGPDKAAKWAREHGLPRPVVVPLFERSDSPLALLPVGFVGKEPRPARRPTKFGGRVSYDSALLATWTCLNGKADALVTAPISKESWAMAITGRGYYPGHTEMLGDQCGRTPLMMLEGGGLRVALVTTHASIRDVPGLIARRAILTRLRILDADLSQLYGIRRPRIAVLGLNPHAGDGGRFGDEEARIIAPAIRAARRQGIRAEGPIPGDAAFHWMLKGRCDAILAMYHDQGLAPLKTLAFSEGVNVTLGLPIVRTSPDHGTAFDIAGKGVADPRSMIAAIERAIELSSRRTARPQL